MPIESIFWIIFIVLFLLFVIALVLIRRRREKDNVHDLSKDEDWLHEKFMRADDCFRQVDPEDEGYRAVVDDTNMTITVTSVKGAQILITPSGLFYKAPDSEVYESVVDAFYCRQVELERAKNGD